MARRVSEPASRITKDQLRHCAATSIRLIHDNLADLLVRDSIAACEPGVQLKLNEALGLLERAARTADPARTPATLETAANSLAQHLFGDAPRHGAVGIVRDGEDALLLVYVQAGWRGRRIDEWEGFPVAWRTRQGKIRAL